MEFVFGFVPSVEIGVETVLPGLNVRLGRVRVRRLGLARVRGREEYISREAGGAKRLC